MSLWNKVLDIGVYDDLTPREERKVRLINGILLIGETLFLLLIIKSVIAGVEEEWTVQLVGALLFPIPILLNYVRMYSAAKLLCLLIPFFYLSALTLYWGSERGSQLILFACSGLAVLFFDKKRMVYAMIALGALCLIAVEIYNFDHDPFYKTPQLKAAYIINIIITVIMLTVISSIFRKESEKFQQNIQDKNQQLVTQHKELLRLNRKLENSLNLIRWQTSYAKTIQNSILPLTEELEEAFKDHFVLYMPKDVVSGDFYFFSQRENRTFLAVVDCTGHGVPGAFMSLIGYNLLLEAIELNEIYTPGQILEYVEERIQYALKQSQTHNKDGMDIALCAIDYNKRELTYSGAKNPLLVIKNGGKVEKIKGEYYSVGGIYDNQIKTFKDHQLSLDDVEAIYMYSDGFQDQFGGDKNRKFMSKRFRQMLIDIHQNEMQQQGEYLQSTLDNWKDGHEQTDDILVMGVRPT